MDVYWQVRVMMSLWWFGGTSHTLTVQLATSADANIDSTTVTPAGAAYHAGAAYQPYCTNTQASNLDHNFTISGTPTANVRVKVASSNGAANWGLR